MCGRGENQRVSNITARQNLDTTIHFSSSHYTQNPDFALAVDGGLENESLRTPICAHTRKTPCHWFLAGQLEQLEQRDTQPPFSALKLEAFHGPSLPCMQRTGLRSPVVWLPHTASAGHGKDGQGCYL